MKPIHFNLGKPPMARAESTTPPLEANPSARNAAVHAASHRPRLLVVAYHYPPHLTPHALRWYHLSDQLARLGYTLDLVTTRMAKRFQDPGPASAARVRVHRTFPGPFFDLTYRGSLERITAAANDLSPSLSTRRSGLARIHALGLQALNTVLLPDAYSEWLPFALARARSLLKRQRPDLLITTSEPPVGHLIGWFLKRAHRLPWIADYGDPWVYPVAQHRQPEWKQALVLRMERAVLAEADAVTVATEGLRQLYRRRFPALAQVPVRVIAQGFDPEAMAAAAPTPSVGFSLVYCGSLYRRLRDPRALFAAVRQSSAEELRLLIAGRINEFAALAQAPECRGRIRHLGFVQPEAALALEKGATVLVHIANASPIQTPGKIYELLAVQRPILVIADHPDDEAVRLVQALNRGRVVANRVDAIAAALNWCIDQWRAGRLDGRFNLAPLETGTWRRRAFEFHQLIAEMRSG